MGIPYEMYDIKLLRKKVKMKQYVLADKLGIEQSNYANIENGKLITSKIPEIKEKAKEILLPMLDSILLQMELDFKTTKLFRNHFNN